MEPATTAAPPAHGNGDGVPKPVDQVPSEQQLDASLTDNPTTSEAAAQPVPVPHVSGGDGMMNQLPSMTATPGGLLFPSGMMASMPTSMHPGAMAQPPSAIYNPSFSVGAHEYMLGALTSFEQEFGLQREEHDNIEHFTDPKFKTDHSSHTLSKVLSNRQIRANLNKLPVPTELYAQAVQLYRIRGRVRFSNVLTEEERKHGARVSSYICLACGRHHGITSAIRHCLRSLRADVKNGEIDWQSWQPCPWTVFGPEFIKGCLQPVPRILKRSNPGTPGSEPRSQRSRRNTLHDLGEESLLDQSASEQSLMQPSPGPPKANSDELSAIILEKLNSMEASIANLQRQVLSIERTLHPITNGPPNGPAPSPGSTPGPGPITSEAASARSTLPDHPPHLPHGQIEASEPHNQHQS